MYTYLLLNIGTLLGPLGLSFDKKVAFASRWKALFPSIALTGLVFILWDVWFTEMGIWSFNPDYLIGVYFLGLPLEEWLFFLTVPYACVFIYDCVKAYFARDYFQKYATQAAWGLFTLLIIIGALHYDHWYTAVTFFGLAGLLLVNLVVWKTPYMGWFFMSYLIALIPFFLVNGVLTAMPVVEYNDLENLGFRLGTVPADDTMYNMLLLLMNINWYEYFQSRFALPALRPQGAHV
ncbi:MAG: lycopene cyclase domain-containing protein [Bacteroidota bacterium]